jgi:3-hydroxyisobutyrate dehydrogenase-like beta-hydroxyacid dehydrogenase
MKDRLFKILFPSKYEEITSLTQKLKEEAFKIRMLKERNSKQAIIIERLNKDLKEIRSAAKKHQKQQTVEAEQKYYRTLREKGFI